MRRSASAETQAANHLAPLTAPVATCSTEAVKKPWEINELPPAPLTTEGSRNHVLRENFPFH